jgi:segregation and condensation protein A
VPYEVHLDVFDGPFDLLLQLISRQEVEIYEIRLADLVDAFVEEMNRATHLDLESSTEFLVIAATLIELKCRRLLPGVDDGDLEDELALYEARDYLLARLVECRTFTSAAAEIAQMEGRAQRSVARRAGADESFDDLAPDLLEGVSPEQLAAVCVAALAARPHERIGDAHVLVDEVSVAETLDQLTVLLREKGESDFRRLTSSMPSKAHVVACFLALLELYKRELVDLEQTETFGTLAVRWVGGEGPVGALEIEDYRTASAETRR